MRVAADSTDVSVIVRIVDATDGTPETGVTSATAGLALGYWREGAASFVGLTESDLATLDAAHSDGGLLHINSGYYRLDIADAAFASGAGRVLISGVADSMVIIGDTVEIGPVVANTVQVEGVDATDQIRDAVVDDATRIDASQLNTNLDAAVSSRSSHSAADVWTAVTRTLSANTNLNDPTSADIADAVWDEAKAEHVAAGSFGDEVQAHALSSEVSALNDPTAADIRAEIDANSTQLASLITAAETDIPALIAALNDITVAEVLAGTVEGGITFVQAQRIMLAVLAGISNGGGTNTINFRDQADTKNRVQATVDSSGNRSAVSVDGV